MAPASATRPDAVTTALVEATWPLLIPIETDVPLLQAVFGEAICTFHSPSKGAAVAGVAAANAASRQPVIADLRDCPMTCALGLDTLTFSRRFRCDGDSRHAGNGCARRFVNPARSPTDAKPASP